MRLVASKVWTPRRRVLGNLIPAIFWLPPAVFGVLQIVVKGQLIGLGLWSLIASTVLGWLSINQFGFFENRKMRAQLEKLLESDGRAFKGDQVFVGFATPKFSSMVDAHEDVGFLRLFPDKLVFLSDSRNVEVLKADLTGVRFRANVHSVLGLGRWVSIEGKVGEQPIRLLLEPRERPTLFGNRLYGAKLRAKLLDWIDSPKKGG
jgi:hypothetical protein